MASYITRTIYRSRVRGAERYVLLEIRRLSRLYTHQARPVTICFQPGLALGPARWPPGSCISLLPRGRTTIMLRCFWPILTPPLLVTKCHTVTLSRTPSSLLPSPCVTLSSWPIPVMLKKECIILQVKY